MKLVLKENAVMHKNTLNSVSAEYEMGDKDINIAVVEINGRYPDKGWVKNTVCKELIYIVDGSGVLTINDKEVLLKSGDAILIEPNEKYFFEGNLKVVPACYPAWSIQQVEIIED